MDNYVKLLENQIKTVTDENVNELDKKKKKFWYWFFGKIYWEKLILNSLPFDVKTFN